jgi:hypothetical protein
MNTKQSHINILGTAYLGFGRPVSQKYNDDSTNPKVILNQKIATSFVCACQKSGRQMILTKATSKEHHPFRQKHNNQRLNEYETPHTKMLGTRLFRFCWQPVSQKIMMTRSPSHEPDQNRNRNFICVPCASSSRYIY